MTRLRISKFVFLAILAVCSSAPAPVPNPDPAVDSRPEIIEIIAPAEAAQETLDSLNLGEPNSEQSERNKRTIGILRQLFPNLSMIVDQKIQQIASFLFRTVGRSILQGAIGGGGGQSGSNSGGSGGKVSVSLPTYSPDDDDDSDEDDDDDKPASAPSLSSRSGEGKDDASESKESNEGKPTTESDKDNEVQASSIEASEQSFMPTTDSVFSSELKLSSSEPTILSDSSTEYDTSTVPATAAVNADENALSEAESQQSEVRVQFTGDGDSKTEESKDESSDQEGAASNNGALDDLSLDGDESDENRDKRFLNFGIGGGDNHASASGGSGGGSGNFLFDIIRRPAESAARAAGQVFRILTGTDSIGLGITATHTAVRDLPDTYTNTLNNASRLLVAGSGASEHSDEAHSAPADGDVAKGDGYTEGIPGPVTRLFIIANRGIANLIQDLILRIAQTSERIVNFKARLITSII